MRFGYSFWGFLGDVKLDPRGNELSTPDGNATYSWSILHEAQRRGWQTYLMQEDRDAPGVRDRGMGIFGSFNQRKRWNAYAATNKTRGIDLPDLDVLLLEWRFPIPGRNCDIVGGLPSFLASHQPDLLRQNMLLWHYKQQGTKIILWDLDHKLSIEDEVQWQPDAVFETSVVPRRLTMDRVRVEPPTVVEDLLEHPTVLGDVRRMMVYIGSRYERDDVIDEWIRPVSEAYPERVIFYGKWFENEPGELRKRWPGIVFFDRCTVRDFHKIYGTAGCVPLLAKRSYLETGFITPRVWEALLFGSIPIGLGSMRGIERYVPEVAHDGRDMIEVAETLNGIDHRTRDRIRKEAVEQISFMDVRHFINRIEDVCF